MKKFWVPVIVFALLSILAGRVEAKKSLFMALELSKDSFALAEPALLTVEINNNSNRDYILDNQAMFSLDRQFQKFTLTLIDPDGVERSFVHYMRVEFSYGSDAKIYFVLPAGEKVKDKKFLWWQHFFEIEYRTSLEDIMPGHYKLLATYRLPNLRGQKRITVYSDTVDFYFKPVEEEHLSVLEELDSLYLYIGGFLSPEVKEKAPESFKRIRDSQTPYSEAAFTRYLLTRTEWDEFIVEKERFDEVYPNSPFVSTLLGVQSSRARMKNKEAERDSLMRYWSQIEPYHRSVLLYEDKLKLVSISEAR